MALTNSKNRDNRGKARTRRRQGEPTRVFNFMESSRLIAAALFLVFAGLITTICFWHPPSRSPSIATGQRALESVVATFDFTYESKILTENKKAGLRTRVAPTLTRVPGVLEAFEGKIHGLDDALRQMEKAQAGKPPAPDATSPTGGTLPANPATPPDRASDTHQEGALAIFAQSEYSSLPADALKKLCLATESEERTRLLSKGLAILGAIYEHPILPEGELAQHSPAETVSLVSIETTDAHILSLKKAQQQLSFRINGDTDLPGLLRDPLIQIFSTGLRPNLRYDADAHARKIQAMEDATQPVLVKVTQNEVILRAGEIITKEQSEKYNSFQKQERELGKNQRRAGKILYRGVLVSLTLLGITWICLKIGFRRVSGRNRLLGLSALGIVINLLLIRIVLQLVETPLFEDQENFLSLLPYLAPTAFAPLTLAIFAGPTLAILSAFVVSLLFSFMLDGSTEIFLASFFATLSGIFFCRNISQRARLMQACLVVGAVNSLLALLFGLLNGTDLQMVGLHILACLAVSILTGMMVIGILPLLENSFKFITDIRLLELTDTNHELLRRMQMEAPGTYHHSLMVANLSENAAVKLGANPLKCRSCSLFHDIGKLVKPEYFIENQAAGLNPHTAKSPSMSALIIKAHIPEGVELAKQYKLPRLIIDVIRQHHGTGLIHYFYHEAQKKTENGNSESEHAANGGNGHEEDVDESTYRYPGPKPQFKESAIIFFADAVEAASRTLPKINAQSIEELIDSIFEERLADGQLDDCPLTFQEISEIKKSFAFTILNMTHARTEYPDIHEKGRRSDSRSPLPKEADRAQAKEDKEPVEADKPEASTGV